ncbi:MAG TPA: long-chain fatty acid--CoA ligase [Candidatus Dormibacteraeota bacterium]|nr:long-chain fatty acid--CoA ligase [Candidatus Dormibacteraeota bacterium]
MLFRQVAKYGDRAMVHHLVGDAWSVKTWAGMKHDVLSVASALLDQGIGAGDRVVLLSENRLEWIYCDFAIQTIGAITVPIYPNSTPEIAQKIVEDSRARFAIASDAAMAAKLEAGGALRAIALIDNEVFGWVSRGPVRSADVDARLRQIKPDDLCTIVYTSGTTGDPKGVELAHRNLVDMGRATLKVHPITDADSTLSFLPYAHVFERINDIFLAVVYGGEVWISRGADHLGQELGEVQPTVMCSVPRMYEKMYAVVMSHVREASATQRALFSWAIRIGTRHFHASKPGPLLAAQHRLADRLVLAPLRKRLTGGRLRFFVSGGAALSREVEEFFWAIGVPILNGWGMTETSSGVCSNTLFEHRFLTVGRPFPGVEIKIAADGEILVKGAGNMIGYHNKPEATAEMVRDGWIHTGDVGELDADGFLKITDRKKSLFKTAGGKYIAPLPLEHALLSNPLVTRAVVVGEGRPYVTALVVPDREATDRQGLDEAGLTASIQQTVDHLNAGLGSWETIKYFALLSRDFTEESGELSLKLDIKRKVIAERYRDRIEAMYTGKSRPA